MYIESSVWLTLARAQTSLAGKISARCLLHHHWQISARLFESKLNELQTKKPFGNGHYSREGFYFGTSNVKRPLCVQAGWLWSACIAKLSPKIEMTGKRIIFAITETIIAISVKSTAILLQTFLICKETLNHQNLKVTFDKVNWGSETISK